MFENNKYSKWYFLIIENAISQNRVKSKEIYYEKHHILPKSLGGSNDSTNLVLLSPREHYICHWLLTKMTNGEVKRKMNYAMSRMVHLSTHKKIISSWMFDTAKRALIEAANGRKHDEATKKKMRENHKGRTGKKASPETLEKMKMSNLNRDPELERIRRDKIRVKKLGQTHTIETKMLLSELKLGSRNHNFGRTRSEETKNKIRATRLMTERKKRNA